MKEIINYLKEQYNPKAIIVYGSYADGSNNANSDFDALVLTDNCAEKYDNSTINGVLLDVFLYPCDIFMKSFDCEDFLQLYDGKIVMDETDTLSKAKAEVKAYMDNSAKKTKEELLHSVTWCEKMLLRSKRQDAEGYYRWHWVLIDSLEIYCNLCDKYYFGPKKTLRKMEKEDPAAFKLYEEALKVFDEEKLRVWIEYLRGLV